MAIIERLMDAFSEPMQCPFCSEKFHLGDCKIVSKVHSNQVVYTPPQGSFKRAWSRVFVEPLSGSAKTRELASRQCPRCLQLLPYNFEEVDDNITIAVIGDTYSGKSHYIAVAIDQLKREQIPPEYGSLHTFASSQEIDERYQRDYYKPLFENRRPLSATQPATSLQGEPLIYEIIIDGTRKKRVNLLLYDASGEDIANQLRLVQHKPHILNAQAIIFLADPWSMPHFVDRLAHHLQPNSNEMTNRMASDVLRGVVQIFQRNEELAGRSFPLPVAIALSKADLIQYLRGIDARYQFLWQAPSNMHGARADSEAVNAAVKKLLEDVNEQPLLRMAQTYAKVNFFAISATGTSPDAQRQYPAIKPYRCLDPLLWLLKELRFIDG